MDKAKRSLEELAKAEIAQMEDETIEREERCKSLIRKLNARWYENRFITYASGSLGATMAGFGIYELASGNYMAAAFPAILTVFCGYNSYMVNQEGKSIKEALGHAKAGMERTAETLKKIEEQKTKLGEEK